MTRQHRANQRAKFLARLDAVLKLSDDEVMAELLKLTGLTQDSRWVHTPESRMQLRQLLLIHAYDDAHQH